ncbi:MAG: precorrin-6A/cobalt-precorrin-6A reductase, partial [Oscillospiraceae bacterium]|nr:precorrin-6A/cobalt-precorrin-6A reductase [Oscillospiraceae bacterium]
MRLLVFGGTTEGRLLAERLAGLGHDVTVSVATELGAEELAGIPGLTVLAGRRDGEEIRRLVRAFALCIDATHPYAAEVTKNIRAACGEEGIPLRRLLRAESPAEGCVRV